MTGVPTKIRSLAAAAMALAAIASVALGCASPASPRAAAAAPPPETAARPPVKLDGVISREPDGGLAPYNHLENPDFERGDLSGWSIYYTGRSGSLIEATKGGVHGGEWMCKLSGTGSLYKVIKVRPSTTYTFSAWGRVEKGGALYYVVKNYDESGGEKNVKVEDGEWSKVTITFTTGPKARTAQVNLYQGGPGGIAYADDAFAGDGQPHEPVAAPRSSPREGAAKLLLLGDSITELCNWRYLLWKGFIDAGKSVDYVGSMDYRNPPRGDWSVSVWPDYKGFEFDYDHEGHAGWASYDILNGCLWEMDRGTLETWVTKYAADIALIHIGTNDAVQGYPNAVSVECIERIIALLQATNPRIDVYLAKIIPTGGPWGSPFDPAVRAINARIDELAKKCSTAASAVYVVDQYEGFDAVADTWDGGVHPNAAGDAKIAGRWLAAVLAHSKLPDL